MTRTSTQHTPGPWAYSPLPDESVISHHNGAPYAIDAEGYRLIARGCDQGGETIANAHLIASAPDLLAALQAIVLTYEYECKGASLNPALADAKAAIAKALGK